MGDTKGVPFEDGPPAVSSRPAADPDAVAPPESSASPPGSAAVGTAPASTAATTDPAPLPPAVSLTGSRAPAAPAPGSPEEAAIIWAALAAGGRTSPGMRAKPGLIVGTAVIVIVTIAGLVIGADYLRHVAASNTNTGSGAAPASLTVTESNLKAALATAMSDDSSHTQSLASLNAELVDANTSLTFPSISGSSSEIAVAIPVSGSLVLTSFQSSPAACMGVLWVFSGQAAPIFAGHAATAHAGTYFFEAPAPAGLCNALTVTPPSGAAYVSNTGFPSERLP